MAEALPFHVLVLIFRAARVGGHDFDHGGETVAWDSNRSTRLLCQVCRGWYDAGTSNLYRSISIVGGDTAELFLRTLRARPELARLVRFAAVGVVGDDDEAADAEAQSSQLLEVVESLELLAHLQVRPLHHALRPRLHAAVQSRQLTSLVLLPRTDPSDQSLYHELDLFELVTPSMQYLEVDFDASSVPHPHAPLPTFPTLALIDFRSFSSGNEFVTLELIKAAGPTLLSVSVYFETLFSNTSLVADALAPSLSTLRNLSFLTNPTIGILEDRYRRRGPHLFDRLLPSFVRLESLCTSATEVSSDVFSLLPASLRDLEIQSLNDRPAFEIGKAQEALRDQSIAFHLSDFTIWEATLREDEVERMRVEFETRGIELHYIND